MSEVDEATQIGRAYEGPKRVVFVVNNDRSFLSHRATWGAALQAAGSEITVIAEDTGEADAIRDLGFGFVGLHVGREASGVIALARSAVLILIALLRIRPNIVFLSAQVAYTLGWPAAIFLRRTRFVRVAGGVGRALDPAVLHTRESRVVRLSARFAGRLKNVFTLFQIEEDRDTFRMHGLLPVSQRSLVIPGTGIDVNAWDCKGERNFEKPVILFASRLYREKGVHEFVAMAENLRGRGWRFQIAGDPDPGVESTVTEGELDRWRRDGAVEVLGRRTDMARVFADATMLVFPTRHPEGTPKVLIEAGASGLPSVVPRHAGCRAVVVGGVTGIVCETASSADWTTAVEKLASDPLLGWSLGQAAREHVSRKFSLQTVVSRLLEWEAVGATRK
ncbi:glycosyltransferase [Mycobacterium frederiksbergense]|uniref:glycosyltransferase n=1 Tax=Mycolicibacterium frederiksbergense TaxID=117567 RepID=UPI0021F37A47|nr:glycosyltransferase [Mycolicibacterium frederiksbergense]MCV7047105.1 glycosyltransferase [Mycolicibacterium frederiksbergense]